MTIEEVRAEVEKIGKERDDEVQHCDEDYLYLAVMTHIAEHCTDELCKALAVEALKTKGLDFCRWYA